MKLGAAAAKDGKGTGLNACGDGRRRKLLTMALAEQQPAQRLQESAPAARPVVAPGSLP